MIPQITKDSIDLYVKEGYDPGDFLYAVLTNNLFDAFGRADEENTAAMKDIILYIYNDITSECWGSKEKVKDWMEKKFLERNKNQ